MPPARPKRPERSLCSARPHPRRGARRLAARVRAALPVAVTTALVLAALPVAGQDWGSEADDPWSRPAAPAPDEGPLSGWSVRAGIGFIDDPTAFLVNVELPYAFDRWVAVGPMFQIGLDDNNTIVAPTLNLSVGIPDLPGEDFDALRPYGFAGVGFAWIEDDNRRNDDSSAGFLVNFGFGLELEVTRHFYVGSQMSFNFLPERTLGQDFFYAWQVGGLRLAF